MIIRAILKDTKEQKEKVVFIVQIFYNELHSCPMCAYIEKDGKELLFLPAHVFKIEDSAYQTLRPREV